MTKIQGWLALAGIFLIANNTANNIFTTVATVLTSALFAYCAYLEMKK